MTEDKLVCKQSKCCICGKTMTWTIKEGAHKVFLGLVPVGYFVAPTVCKDCTNSPKLPGKVRLYWKTQAIRDTFDAEIVG